MLLFGQGNRLEGRGKTIQHLQAFFNRKKDKSCKIFTGGGEWLDRQVAKAAKKLKIIPLGVLGDLAVKYQTASLSLSASQALIWDCRARPLRPATRSMLEIIH